MRLGNCFHVCDCLYMCNSPVWKWRLRWETLEKMWIMSFLKIFILVILRQRLFFVRFFCEKIGVIPVMYSCLMLKGSWHGSGNYFCICAGSGKWENQGGIFGNNSVDKVFYWYFSWCFESVMRFDGGCYRKVSYMTVKNDVKSRIDRKKKRWCLNDMTKLLSFVRNRFSDFLFYRKIKGFCLKI